MTNVIAFPGLGLEFTMNRVALSVGPFTIYWYGIIIAIGFMLAVWYGMHRIKEIGLKSDDLIDLLLDLSQTGAQLGPPSPGWR